MLNTGELQSISADGTRLGAKIIASPHLVQHVVPFGRLSGISEALRRQEAHVASQGVPHEFAQLKGPEVTYLSILKELGLFQLQPGNRRMFVEYFHPYYNLLNEQPNLGGEITRRGLPQLDEAFALGNQFTKFAEEFDIDTTRVIFIDNVSQSQLSSITDQASKNAMILSQVGLPFGVTLYDSRVNGVMTGVKIATEPGSPEWFDMRINEGQVMPDATELAIQIAEAARSKGYRVQGARSKIHFNDSEEVALLDSSGRPSCEVLDLAYRRLLTWDNNTEAEPFHGGVIILPESFRRQQERVNRISKLMGWNQNIVTVLQD